MTVAERLALDMFDAGLVAIDLETGYTLKLHEQNLDVGPSPAKILLHTPKHPTAPGSMQPEMTMRIAAHLLERAKKLHLQFDAVAGIPYAGDPLAEAFAELCDCHIIKLGKTTQSDGHRTVDHISDRGERMSSSRVLLLDNAISTGESASEAIGTLLQDGFRVSDTLSVLTWELGGRERLLREKQVQADSLYEIGTALAFWRTHNRISAEEHAAVLHFREKASACLGL